MNLYVLDYICCMAVNKYKYRSLEFKFIIKNATQKSIVQSSRDAEDHSKRKCIAITALSNENATSSTTTTLSRANPWGRGENQYITIVDMEVYLLSLIYFISIIMPSAFLHLLGGKRKFISTYQKLKKETNASSPLIMSSISYGAF